MQKTFFSNNSKPQHSRILSSILFFTLSASSFFSCATTSQAATTPATHPATRTSTTAAVHTIKLTNAEHILSQMTTEEKVSQLFIVTPEQLTQETIDKKKGSYTSVDNRLVTTTARYPVGGFILFKENIQTPEQLRSFNKQLSTLSPIPPILAIDEEGGRVSRLANNENFFLPKFKSTETIGKTENIENARGAGQIIGAYLSTYGFTLDFAPDADINTNPENIVIGDRAFGSTPLLVTQMAGAFLSGLHSTGMKGCLKHFPGHGDTKGDTHLDYATVTKTWEELKNCELIPFVKNFPSADCIMIAHVTCTSIDKVYPSSLSKTLITDKLRGELGYKGVIVSDALNMGAIKKNYDSAEATLFAFEAGNDIILMPQNFHASYEAILNALKSGRISENRLNESVLRILKLKGF